MTVVDQDLGYAAMMRALSRAEGITAWVGILSGRIYYPKKYRSWKYGKREPKFTKAAKRKPKYRKRFGRAEVAKVAAVLQMEGGWVSHSIDGHMTWWNREWDKVAARILQAGDPVQIMADFATLVRDTMRKELEKRFHMRSRKLLKTIGFRVGVPADRGFTGIMQTQPRWAKILRERGPVSRL